MKALTASDRSTLVRLAASLPKGDETRRAILAGLKKAETIRKNDYVSDSEGNVGRVVSVSGDGDSADVEWNGGGGASLPIEDLTKVDPKDASKKKAGELPEALKKNMENPPPAVQKVKEEMKSKKASRRA